MIGGCDVSQYQGVINWPALKASGKVAFVIMRATYGLTGIDAQFRANQAGARSAGIPCGYYHFADGYAATSEAQHFLATVGPLMPGETLWLDDEIALPEHNAWACSFIDVLRPHVAIPGLYSNYSGFRSIGVVPGVIAWIAFPGPAPLAPPAGYTAAQTLLNQVSTGPVPGAGGSADIDYLLANSIDVFTSWGAGGQGADVTPAQAQQLADLHAIFFEPYQAGAAGWSNVEVLRRMLAQLGAAYNQPGTLPFTPLPNPNVTAGGLTAAQAAALDAIPGIVATLADIQTKVDKDLA